MQRLERLIKIEKTCCTYPFHDLAGLDALAAKLARDHEWKQAIVLADPEESLRPRTAGRLIDLRKQRYRPRMNSNQLIAH